MKWEVLNGLDVVGSDLESIADKKMALSECFSKPNCAGFVWSEAQGQAYLKHETAARESRKKELRLSLYVPAYDEHRGFTINGVAHTSQKVSNPDEAKRICETSSSCKAFAVSTDTHIANFFSASTDMKKDPGSTLFRRVSMADLPDGTTSAELVGEENVLPPKDISEEPPIIVGGTDGSGTRAVVTLLSNLNVLMVKDDACTFDVHAGEMGGWPPVVRRALRFSHGANYKPEDIPENDRAYLRRSLKRFADKMKKEAKRFSRMKRHERWGFKAPIAQMLLPFLDEVFPGFSFVQVLRDGRDLPFSKNQSPVDKFYVTMYKGAKDSYLNLDPKFKAIRMWSDANTQVQTYMNTVQVPKGSIYLRMKIENSVEEESLLQMGYVCNEKLKLGYKREDMCCRLRGYISHLKKADFFRGVKSRYGKWEKITENNLPLRNGLQEHGKEGLEAFGYLNEDRRVALYETPTFKICEDVPSTEICEFDFPSKCIESPNIR